MRIIFKNLDGSIGIIAPTDDILLYHTIQEVAEKDVPADLPYVIVETKMIPTDRTFRDAWELPADTVFDGVGSASDEFIRQS